MANTNGSKTILSQDTRVSPKLILTVIGLIFLPLGGLVVGGVAAYGDIKHDLEDGAREREEIREAIRTGKGQCWSVKDDEVFMDRYTSMNGLRMPNHEKVTN